jgi:hypothetical protein
MSADQWFYRLDGRPHGPFTPAQFEKLIRGHAVSLDTEVSLDGHLWKPLRDVLATMLASAPPDPEPAEPIPDWMNAPTLVPGDMPLPTSAKPKTKPPG